MRATCLRLAVEVKNPDELYQPAGHGFSQVTIVPAGTLIPVPRLALDGIIFEIDAVAILPS